MSHLGVWTLLLAGCVEAPALELSLERSEAVETSFEASWEGDGEQWVEYGHDGGFDRFAEGQTEGGLATAVLWALRPDTEVQARLCEADACGEAVVATTGSAPSWMPEFAGATEAGASEQALLLSIPPLMAAAVVDADGTPLWWDQADVAPAATSSVSMSPDKDSVLYNLFNVLVGSESTYLREVSLDGESVVDTELDLAHHDFVMREDGTLAYLAYDEQEVEGELVRGDRIIERSPEGDEVTVWSSWDTLEFSDRDTAVHGDFTYWSLANALVFAEGRYYVSLRGLDSIVAIDAESGEQDWRFGRTGDFSLDTERWPVGQHHFEIDGDELLLFDNSIAAYGTSRAVRYVLDESSMSATETWSYTSEDATQALILGDVDTLDNGHVLVTFSQNGLVEEVTEDGEVLRVLETVEGYAFGYTQPIALR